MDVFKNRPRSLVDFIELSASHGEKPYLIYQDKVISFTQHLRLVKKAAHILQSQHNVKPGDRVAIYAANCPEWIIFFWATVSIGAIACGLNGWWKGSELASRGTFTQLAMLAVSPLWQPRICAWIFVVQSFLCNLGGLLEAARSCLELLGAAWSCLESHGATWM